MGGGEHAESLCTTCPTHARWFSPHSAHPQLVSHATATPGRHCCRQPHMPVTTQSACRRHTQRTACRRHVNAMKNQARQIQHNRNPSSAKPATRHSPAGGQKTQLPTADSCICNAPAADNQQPARPVTGCGKRRLAHSAALLLIVLSEPVGAFLAGGSHRGMCGRSPLEVRGGAHTSQPRLPTSLHLDRDGVPAVPLCRQLRVLCD